MSVAVILALSGGVLAGSYAPVSAQAVIVSTDQTTTQNLDTLAGGDPGIDAVINPGVTVDTSNPPGAGGNALFGTSRAWEITNGGFVTGQARGIDLGAGGVVINDPGASITGLTNEGLRIRNATGTVINSGDILGRREGVFLFSGGFVTNNAGGTITSNTREAIQIQGGTGTVDNSGIILGNREAVYLLSGGTVTNNAGGSITSTNREAIQIQGGTGTVDNSGILNGAGDAIFLRNSGDVTNRAGATITGGADGIQINQGGSVTNEANAFIIATNNVGIRIQSGAGTVDNAGSIDARQEGILLASGGTVTNAVTGSITSAIREGVQISGAPGTVDNLGTITSGTIGVFLDRGGSLTNHAGGTIDGGTIGTRIDNGGVLMNLAGGMIVGNGGNGAEMRNGGTVTNEAGALISGTNRGVFVTGGAGTVTNGGDIAGTQFGIFLNNGGTITNAEGATIVATNSDGIRINSGSTDIINAGTITGSGANAIRFGNSGDSLTLQTGSILNGNVDARNGNDRLVLEGTGSEDSNFLNFETFTMQGTDWTLSGTSGFNTASIDSGILRVTGTLNSPLTIAPGGTLGGNGTIGGAVVNNGDISPGAGIATLNLGNTYTQAPNTIYNVDIEPGGGSDLLAIAGAATLNGGTVEVSAAPGSYAPSTIFTIVDAGSVTGTFDGVTSDSAFVDPSLSYTATTVELIVAVLPFTSFAETPNQMDVARYLDTTAPTATGDYGTVVGTLFSLTPTQYQNALNQISGDVHATTTGFSLRTQDQFTSIIEVRQNNYWTDGQSPAGDVTAARQDDDLGLAFGSTMTRMSDKGGYWIQGYYVGGDVDGDGNAAGSDFDIQGVAGGIDAQVSPELLIGAALGTAWANADFASRNGASTDIESFQAGAYASYFDGAWNLDGIVSYGVQDIESERPISFGGIQRVASADYDARVLSAYGKAGYVFDAAPNTYVEPLISVGYSHAETDGFQETGAGSLNLNTNAMTRDSLRSGVGAELTHHYWLDDGSLLTPRVHALWSHEFLDTDATFDATLTGAPGAPTFSIAGVETGRDSADLGGSVTYDMAEQVSLFAGYRTNLSKDGTSHTVQGGLRFVW